MIIPCGKKKIWDVHPEKGETKVKDAYIGVFHNLCKQYAEKFGDEWVILSAKYGYLLPEEYVKGAYDLSFDHKNKSVISLEALQAQVRRKKFDDFSSITVLTGKKYKPYIEKSFEGINVTMYYPLAEAKGIGYMQSMLKNAVINNKLL